MPKKSYGAGRIYKDNGWLYLDYSFQGKRHRESAHTKDRTLARELLATRLRELADGRFAGSASVTLASLFEDVLIDYEINDKRSLSDLRARIIKHLGPYFGGKPAAKLTTRDVQAYTKHRLEAGATNGTINRELAVLKRAYTLGIRSERVHRKPYIPMLQEANARKGFFEREELDRVLTALPSWLHPPILFAYYTGWRIHSEIMPMQWSQVDLKHATMSLYVGETNNKEARTIFLPELLLGLLQAQKERQERDYPGCEWVFDRHGEQIKSFRKRWLEARKVSGLSERILHDFRRTAVRNMVRAGVPERVAMLVTGHKTRGVFERYNIVSTGDLKEAAKKLIPETTAEQRQRKVFPISARAKKTA
jgi:integrase